MTKCLLTGLVSLLATHVQAQMPYKDAPEQQVIQCLANIESYQSYAEFNINPDILKKMTRNYDDRMDEIPLENGETVAVHYRLREISKDAATVAAWIQTKKDNREILSLLLNLPLTGTSQPVIVMNPERKARLTCSSQKIQIPLSQPLTHGGFFHLYK